SGSGLVAGEASTALVRNALGYFDDVADDRLGEEGEQAQPQAQEEDRGAQAASLRFLRQVPDDEGHERDQPADEGDHHPLFEYFGFHMVLLTGIDESRSAGRRAA